MSALGSEHDYYDRDRTTVPLHDALAPDAVLPETLRLTDEEAYRLFAGHFTGSEMHAARMRANMLREPATTGAEPTLVGGQPAEQPTPPATFATQALAVSIAPGATIEQPAATPLPAWQHNRLPVRVFELEGVPQVKQRAFQVAMDGLWRRANQLTHNVVNWTRRNAAPILGTAALSASASIALGAGMTAGFRFGKYQHNPGSVKLPHVELPSIEFPDVKLPQLEAVTEFLSRNALGIVGSLAVAGLFAILTRLALHTEKQERSNPTTKGHPEWIG